MSQVTGISIDILTYLRMKISVHRFFDMLRSVEWYTKAYSTRKPSLPGGEGEGGVWEITRYRNKHCKSQDQLYFRKRVQQKFSFSFINMSLLIAVTRGVCNFPSRVRLSAKKTNKKGMLWVLQLFKAQPDCPPGGWNHWQGSRDEAGQARLYGQN